jgi:hypothetical protein
MGSLLGGTFTTISGVGAQHTSQRLNADGTLDLGFAPIVNSAVDCTAVQADGKICSGAPSPRSVVWRATTASRG